MIERVEPIENYALCENAKPKAGFSKVGIVGCGTLGRSIARLISTYGYEVIFIEVSDEKIGYVLNELDKELDIVIQKWGMTKGEKRAALSRIKGSTDYFELTGCDVVIEAVMSKKRENSVEKRKQIFKTIERFVEHDAIIATNSTTLVITEMSAELLFPERCVSLHFLDIGAEAHIVEIAKGLYTSDEVIDKVNRFVRTLDKEAISVVESPGLITVRLTVPYINEACEILMEGIGSIKDIDKSMRLGFGHSFGPFEMADKIGIDKVLRWMDNLYGEYGDMKYKASPLIKRLVRANKLGRKKGEGFYRYNENGKIIGETKI